MSYVYARRRPIAALATALTCLFVAACGGGTPKATTVAARRSFPAAGPWVSFYGSAEEMGDLDRVAQTFRIINIDADPGAGNFTSAQITCLKAGGANRVLSYLNLGSMESFRTYWKQVPSGFIAGTDNRAAQRGFYSGYPDEVWMAPSNKDYQYLVLDYIAPRLVAQGVDGFYFDNLEIVEHGTSTDNGPCNAACSQGGLDLVRRLRERYPTLLFVMQNATGDTTRTGSTGGVAYPSLLDGIAHEEVYAPTPDTEAARQLIAWKSLSRTAPFWIGTEDYVGSCSNQDAARVVYTRSRAAGFSPYVTDASDGQHDVCYWPF